MMHANDDIEHRIISTERRRRNENNTKTQKNVSQRHVLGLGKAGHVALELVLGDQIVVNVSRNVEQWIAHADESALCD